jgi:hypothetical protein
VDSSSKPDRVAFARYEAALKLCGETQLLEMLGAVEVRLGQPAERAGDIERAQAIAHRLNNLRTGRPRQ